MNTSTHSRWQGGLAEWREGETLYLSVAFSWKVPEAYDKAVFARAQGLQVLAGGPGLFHPTMRAIIERVATVEKRYDDALKFHNPLATVASRGCDVGCYFCIVPKLEGRTYTLLPDFPVRPILCDNNLSGLPVEYQNYIIGRYRKAGVPLLDANSGFEPRSFTEDVFNRWKAINRGPWRFACDDERDREPALRVMKMLRDVRPKLKRVYVLIGNEPFVQCMERIRMVIENGCEPHVQPEMKLNTLERRPWVRFDWTEQKLKDVARWANGFVYKRCRFEDYDRHLRNSRLQPSGAPLLTGLADPIHVTQ